MLALPMAVYFTQSPAACMSATQSSHSFLLPAVFHGMFHAWDNMHDIR